MAEVVGLIVARGGSKTIPGKNIAPVAGKPLMAWTIEAARASQSLTRVVVSTDEQIYADVARSFGADVPFIRPRELAQDDSDREDVILHALQWLEDHERYCPDYLMLLQPTSPLRTAEDIDAAVAMARHLDAEAVVSVTKAPSHPYLAMSLAEDGRLTDFMPKPTGYLRRQSFPPAYALNGAVFLARRAVLLTRRSFYTDRTYAYVMPAERSLDVDTSWDLHLADLVLRATHGGEGRA